MRSFIQVVLGAALLVSPVSATGQERSAPHFVLACAPCHGFDGMGYDKTVPNLAGQHREYLYRQLLAFRSGQRRHPTMNFFSGQMTQDELQQIADYYSGLPSQ